jgi:hypothetical protein
MSVDPARPNDPNDPNGIRSEGWLRDPGEFPSKLPEGVQATDQWYAYQRTYNNGRQVIQWFKRGSGSGGQDPVATEQEITLPGVQKEFEQRQQQQQTAAGRPVNVSTRYEAGTRSDGTKTLYKVSVDKDGKELSRAEVARSDWPTTGQSREETRNGRRVRVTPYDYGLGEKEEDLGPAPAPDTIGKPTGNTETTLRDGQVVVRTEYQVPDGQGGTKLEWREQVKPADQAGAATGNRRETTTNGAKTVEIEMRAPDGSTYWVKQESTGPAEPPKERISPSDPTRLQRWDPSANGGKGDWVDTGTVPPKPGQIMSGRGPNGEDVQAVIDPKTGDITYKPIVGAVGAPGPIAGLGAPQLSLGTITADLQRTSDELARRVALPEGDPDKISPAQADAEMKRRHEFATRAIQEQTASITAQQNAVNQQLTQRSQDIGQANTRLGAATSIFNQADTTFRAGLGKSSGAGARYMAAALRMARAYADQMGGLRESPAVQIPSFVNATPTGAPAASVSMTTPGPATAVPASVNVPAAVGAATGVVESIPGVSTPPAVPDYGTTSPGIAPGITREDPAQAEMNRYLLGLGIPHDVLAQVG